MWYEIGGIRFHITIFSLMKKALKFILIVVVTGTILSASCKEVGDQTPDETVATSEGFIDATITGKYSGEGCGFIVAVEDGKETLLYDPIVLDEAYKKEGLKVKIKFHTSRIKQETCLIATPIIIDEIMLQ